MPKSLYLLVTLFLLPASVTAEIFKCTDENGKVVYQNFVCELDSIGSAATASPPQEQSAAAAPQSTPLQSAPVQARPAVVSRQVANTDQAAGAPAEPRIGMTAAQVRASSWGQPVSMITEEGADQVVHRWSYGDKGTVVLDYRRRVIAVQR